MEEAIYADGKNTFFSQMPCLLVYVKACKYHPHVRNI